MKILYAVLVCCFSMVFLVSVMAEEKVDGHVIPKDSKSEWDFRGELSPFLMTSKSAKKLLACMTYEELRDTLKTVFTELDGSKA